MVEELGRFLLLLSDAEKKKQNFITTKRTIALTVVGFRCYKGNKASIKNVLSSVKTA